MEINTEMVNALGEYFPLKTIVCKWVNLIKRGQRK